MIFSKDGGKNGVRVILHEQNQGKGAAVVTGIRPHKGDVILIQDADLEYSPTDYPALFSRSKMALQMWYTAHVFSAGRAGQSCSGI